MGSRGYHPNQLGFTMPPSVDLPVDVKEWGFTWRHQFDRAERAIDRFRSFENRRADDEAVFALVDEFFEAALTVWHCRDAARKHLEDEEARARLEEFLGSEDQQILRTIANASKHSGIDRAGHFKEEIVLDLAGRHDPQTDMLSDVYRRLGLKVGDRDPEHPADFLTRVMNQWNRFVLEKLARQDFLKQLSSE